MIVVARAGVIAAVAVIAVACHREADPPPAPAPDRAAAPAPPVIDAAPARPDPDRVRFTLPSGWVVDRGLITLTVGEIVYIFSYGTEDPTATIESMQPATRRAVPGGLYLENAEGFFYILDSGITCGGSLHRGGMYENMPAARDAAVAAAKQICAGATLAP